MTLSWREAALERSHDRKAFDCGEAALNDYLVRYARQNHESGGAKTFVAVPLESPTQIIGYYSVCPASLSYTSTPETIRRGLERYEVPVFRLGRLAVDKSAQGQGLGGQLFFAAARRCFLVAAKVGGVALLIDAKNERVAKWYASYGAIACPDTPLSLVLPFTTVKKLLEASLSEEI